MKAGKIGVKKLSNTILNQITHHRKDVLLGAQIGEDSAVVDFGENSLVISSDPITGAAQNAGYLAVNVACNDLASTGATPIGVEVVLLLPTGTTEEKTIKIMKEIDSSAQEIDVEVLGGHTEVLDLVTEPIIVVTAIGKVKKGRHIPTSKAKAGDDIILTKGAGIEGTYILANDFENKLIKKNINKEILDSAKKFKNKISVITEGEIAAELMANALHDITEGGLYGGVKEMALASNLGYKIYKDKVIVNKETAEITKLLELDPLGLISSGSMLIAASNGEEILRKLNEKGIKGSIIGKFTADKNYILYKKGKKVNIEKERKDELWRFLEKN
ncbi:MAG TPA: AIR synthase family protein [Halanaerobiales bacterium]|nr:AIR synthase family protein [Halanaerobiales bacterium]